MKLSHFLVTTFLMTVPALADQKTVYLEDAGGGRIEIAHLNFAPDGTYSIEMNAAPFTDHFLSMRPFKCLEGPTKHWCHVPYPYTLSRTTADDLVDLEYDFLFLWKGATEYGINMWNGVYYKLSETDGKLTGRLHEMDMNGLAAPPDPGVLRPISNADLHEADPDSHWLPFMVIE